ncbi:hypothetical protein [Nostoc sp.]|uniref:hypothetical protein n=1 Tax=Nostoc sp. TaxID=1180 RepID=UPI003593A28A
MVFQKIFSKLGLLTKLIGLTLILSLSFLTVHSTAATTLYSATQPVEKTDLKKHEGFLLAASTQLDQLFNQAVFSTPQVKEIRGHSNYDNAYNDAWGWFTYVTTGSLRGPYWSPNAGWIYEADLIGGGRANIREYGSSGLYPTIDTLDHNSPNPNFFVREVKFKY